MATHQEGSGMTKRDHRGRKLWMDAGARVGIEEFSAR